MKTFSLFLATLLLAQIAIAKTVEIRSMKEVIPHITSSTLLVFDIDNTILEPVQTLGSDQGFGFWVDQGLNRGLSKESATRRAITYASRVQPISEVRAVERKTPSFIHSLQQSGLKVIALTARPPQWAKGTLNQLHSLKVDFRKSSPPGQVELEHSGYTNGVMFVKGGHNKGEALIEFMKAARLSPNRILFIDDKLYNVESVEEALEKTNLEHVSFRYGAADPRVASFNPLVMRVQWFEFLKSGRFITDEEAFYRLRSERRAN